MHDPDIIIFDELSNGLDVLTAKMVSDYLMELKEEGKNDHCFHSHFQSCRKNMRPSWSFYYCGENDSL